MSPGTRSWSPAARRRCGRRKATGRRRAEELADAWNRYGLRHVALELADCPDRRLARSAVALVSGELAKGDTEVSVLLPDRKYEGRWHHILHDQTAVAIERAVSELPHANVTTVPFHLASCAGASTSAAVPGPAAEAVAGNGRADPGARVAISRGRRRDGTTPIGDVQLRQRIDIEGRVRSARIRPLAGTSTLECVIEDDTGAMSVVFLGRPRIAGIHVGTHLRAHGTASEHHGRLAMLNPAYELLASGSERRLAGDGRD